MCGVWCVDGWQLIINSVVALRPEWAWREWCGCFDPFAWVSVCLVRHDERMKIKCQHRLCVSFVQKKVSVAGHDHRGRSFEKQELLCSRGVVARSSHRVGMVGSHSACALHFLALLLVLLSVGASIEQGRLFGHFLPLWRLGSFLSHA
jgi:hypothetical protein